MTFKAGDIIAPVRFISHVWVNMKIIDYSRSTKKATVITESGKVISEFNLDPKTGHEFKVVSHTDSVEDPVVITLTVKQKGMLLDILEGYPRNMREPFETNGEFREHLAELDKLIKEIEIS